MGIQINIFCEFSALRILKTVFRRFKEQRCSVWINDCLEWGWFVVEPWI